MKPAPCFLFIFAVCYNTVYMFNKRFLRRGLGFLLGFIFLTNFIFLATAQEVKIEVKKTIYDLPYAGILPDHPLFFLKNIRDRVFEFATRDQLKKANLYLLLSDKRMRMAIELFEKGKGMLAVDSVVKAEAYFLKIPDLLTTSKKQGAAADGVFILRLKTAIEKHREIIESLIKDVSDSERKKLEEILKVNKLIKNKLSSF